MTRARLYQTLRTAHLEQAHELSPATIVFRAKRYDFDQSAAQGLQLVQRGPLGAARYLFGSDVTEFEVNEPLMRYAIRGNALALAAIRVRDRLRGRRTLVVSYAIENLDPFARRPTSAKGRVRDVVDRALTRSVWRRIDRIVYGTAASQQLYESSLPRRRRPLDTLLLPTLPQACRAEDASRVAGNVVFLGALTERKGFSLIMATWDDVRLRHPDATLLIMGKGALESEAVAWAAERPSVTVMIDPERAEIHRRLRAAQVLVLPSQPTLGWKEQLGLPITEALSHGVSIVSTDETGIADWLRDHGHAVIPASSGASELADAIARMLEHPVTPDEVIASLPERDGRLAADDWLFRAV